jgi:hypothetical protein
MVVDGDSSDLFECISWYHMVIVCVTLISLSRPVSIAKHPVEKETYTIFTVVLKPDKVDSFSHVFLLLRTGWPFKNRLRFRMDGHCICQPDRGKGVPMCSLWVCLLYKKGLWMFS